MERILNDLKNILNDRKGTHGSFEKNSKHYKDLQKLLNNNPEDHQLAFDMIVGKLVRIKQTPEVKDHWMDIIGYATLQLKRLYAKEDNTSKR